MVTNIAIQDTARTRLNMLNPIRVPCCTSPHDRAATTSPAPSGYVPSASKMANPDPRRINSDAGIAASGIVVRAGYLQLVHKDFLQDQGDERFLRVVETPPTGG